MQADEIPLLFSVAISHREYTQIETNGIEGSLGLLASWNRYFRSTLHLSAMHATTPTPLEAGDSMEI